MQDNEHYYVSKEPYNIPNEPYDIIKEPFHVPSHTLYDNGQVCRTTLFRL